MTKNHNQVQGHLQSHGAKFTITNDQVLSVEEDKYLIHYSAIDAKFQTEQETELVTVINVAQDVSVTRSWLEQVLQDYDKDDVFRKEFLETVAFHGINKKDFEERIRPDAKELLSDADTKRIYCLDADDVGNGRLRPGPYVLKDGGFRTVWRLRPDVQEAFLLTLQPGLQTDFTELRTTTSGDGYRDVAVPSRLRVYGLGGSPLMGMRIAVKDMFHLKGVKTSLSNRAYWDTYGPQQKTAVCIQKLIDSGTTILGKTKLSSFGHWEEPMEYIDYRAPWNPRGDGYQSPGGSSSGSACAVAAYDWIDVTIGGDTIGSIMRPALWAGVFGMRPTHDALTNDGMVPSLSYLDTPCFLARDLALCKTFADAWYGDRLCQNSIKFTQIIWPIDYWLEIGAQQTKEANDFVEDLEKCLGVKRKIISFTQEWDAHPPIEAGSLSLLGYTQDAQTHIWYDDYHGTDDFRSRYRKMFNKAPFVSPPVRAVWAAAEPVTRPQRDQAVDRLNVCKRWFNDRFITNHDGQHGQPLFVLPIEDLSPRYRDDTEVTKPSPMGGVNSLFLSPLLGTPELIVPVGEIVYASRITERDEVLTFAVGLMGPKGTDTALIETIHKCLAAAGRPTSVRTGPRALKGVPQVSSDDAVD